MREGRGKGEQQEERRQKRGEDGKKKNKKKQKKVIIQILFFGIYPPSWYRIIVQVTYIQEHSLTLPT